MPLISSKMINRFSNLEEIASNLEHFATVLHDQVRRGYIPADAGDFGKLEAAVELLDRVSLELCEAQEEDEARQETEADLNQWLNGDAVRSAMGQIN